jgi:hypothetical protein
MQLRDLPEAVLVFTGPDGAPVLSLGDLEAVADMGGFEACLAWSGRCIVESAGVDAGLRDAMVASRATPAG